MSSNKESKRIQIRVRILQIQSKKHEIPRRNHAIKSLHASRKQIKPKQFNDNNKTAQNRRNTGPTKGRKAKKIWILLSTKRYTLHPRSNLFRYPISPENIQPINPQKHIFQQQIHYFFPSRQQNAQKKPKKHLPLHWNVDKYDPTHTEIGENLF